MFGFQLQTYIWSLKAHLSKRNYIDIFSYFCNLPMENQTCTQSHSPQLFLLHFLNSSPMLFHLDSHFPSQNSADAKHWKFRDMPKYVNQFTSLCANNQNSFFLASFSLLKKGK